MVRASTTHKKKFMLRYKVFTSIPLETARGYRLTNNLTVLRVTNLTCNFQEITPIFRIWVQPETVPGVNRYPP